MPTEVALKPNLNLTPPVVLSPTLAADADVKRLRDAGKAVYHMGFGQAPFPAPARLIEAVQDHAHEKAYLPVAGLPELRSQVAQHQQRLLGTPAEDMDVLVAPGSKLIIYAVQMAVAGDLLLPTPSWVSYAPQATMLGQQVVPVSTQLSNAGIELPADQLDDAIVHARAAGKNPTKLLINYPSNPTGLTIPTDNLKAIAEVCIKHNICIISDEIYGRLTFDGDYRSISEFAPHHTVVTTGLSKHLSLGGWRLGVGTVPKAMTGLFDALSGIASETWSCVAAPIQIAAIDAYAGHDDIERTVSDSATIHKAVTRYLADELNALGIQCFTPQGGFYVWPDFRPLVDTLGEKTPNTSAELTKQLVNEVGIVALPGTAFGEAPDVLKLRLSVCDYDGAEALEYLRALDRPLEPSDIQRFAPRVVGGVAGFKQLIETWQ